MGDTGCGVGVSGVWDRGMERILGIRVSLFALNKGGEMDLRLQRCRRWALQQTKLRPRQSSLEM